MGKLDLFELQKFFFSLTCTRKARHKIKFEFNWINLKIMRNTWRIYAKAEDEIKFMCENCCSNYLPSNSFNSSQNVWIIFHFDKLRPSILILHDTPRQKETAESFQYISILKHLLTFLKKYRLKFHCHLYFFYRAVKTVKESLKVDFGVVHLVIKILEIF